MIQGNDGMLGYEVFWDAESEEFVGVCPAYPFLSWMSVNVDEAYVGIKALVKAAIEDLQDGD